MKNTKICKGINKAHGFESCGKQVEASRRKYGLCPVCFWDWMQNTDGGKTHYKKQFIPKVEKNVEKQLNKKKKEQRESLKSIRRLINDARIPFQKWIRLRDANRECAACGDTNMNVVHASHIFKAEIYTGLIFDERNVHSCCNKCNVFLNGNEVAFREGIAKRYGESYIKSLSDEADKKRYYKFTRQELIDIKKYYQDKYREELKSM